MVKKKNEENAKNKTTREITPVSIRMASMKPSQKSTQRKTTIIFNFNEKIRIRKSTRIFQLGMKEESTTNIR